MHLEYSQVERNWALGLQMSLSVIRIHIEKHKYEHGYAKCHFVVIGIFNMLISWKKIDI